MSASAPIISNANQQFVLFIFIFASNALKKLKRFALPGFELALINTNSIDMPYS
jgi:hypothetical protein